MMSRVRPILSTMPKTRTNTIDNHYFCWYCWVYGCTWLNLRLAMSRFCFRCSIWSWLAVGRPRWWNNRSRLVCYCCCLHYCWSLCCCCCCWWCCVGCLRGVLGRLCAGMRDRIDRMQTAWSQYVFGYAWSDSKIDWTIFRI